MALVKFYYIYISVLLLLSTVASLPAFEAGAYIPAYRLKYLPGAENTLGRPSLDPAPGSWYGHLASPQGKSLRNNWYEDSWSLKIARGFDSYYLHIPMDESFLGGITPDFRQISYLESLIKDSPPRIYLSLIGDSSDFMPDGRTELKMEQIVQRLQELCMKYKLNGIDIDWEFPAAPRANEIKGINLLATMLKRDLPAGTVLSFAVSRWRLPDAELFKIADEIHLMAYDGYGKHSTFESAVADVEILMTRYRLLPDKMILGIPYYGRNFNPQSDGYWKETKNYAEIVRDFAPEASYDTAGEYFFNGRSTVAKKIEWAIEKSLGGIFVWEPFYDADGEDSLTEEIHRVLTEN